jgi:hypothetical protein
LLQTLDFSSNSLGDVESADLLRELIRRTKTIASLCIAYNASGSNANAARSILEGVRSNTAIHHLDLRRCGLGDQAISIVANTLAIWNVTMLELDLRFNEITSVGIRALVDNVEAVKTLTKLCLALNPSEGKGRQNSGRCFGS